LTIGAHRPPLQESPKAFSFWYYSPFCGGVQERNKKQGKDSLLTEAAAKPHVQWIEAEMDCGLQPRCAGDGMEIELLGGGARLRVRDERDAELAAVALRAMGGGARSPTGWIYEAGGCGHVISAFDE
jgi:hypothetical protein